MDSPPTGILNILVHLIEKYNKTDIKYFFLNWFYVYMIVAIDGWNIWQ